MSIKAKDAIYHVPLVPAPGQSLLEALLHYHTQHPSLQTSLQWDIYSDPGFHATVCHPLTFVAGYPRSYYALYIHPESNIPHIHCCFVDVEGNARDIQLRNRGYWYCAREPAQHFPTLDHFKEHFHLLFPIRAAK